MIFEESACGRQTAKLCREYLTFRCHRKHCYIRILLPVSKSYFFTIRVIRATVDNAHNRSAMFTPRITAYLHVFDTNTDKNVIKYKTCNVMIY